MTFPTTPESQPDLTDAERAEAIKALREFFEAQGFDVSSMDDADLDPASYERVLADEAPSAGGDKTARGPVELPAMYRDDNRASLSDDNLVQDHLTAHWGF